MMRNFLTGVALLAALGVSVAAGVEAIRQAVQGPVQIIIDGVTISGDDYQRGALHALLAYEFDDSGDRTSKRYVLEMLEDRLDERADIASEWKTLSRADRLRVQQIVLHLAPVWLDDHSEKYAALPYWDQPYYLDQQIERLVIWAQASSALGTDHGSLMEGIDLPLIDAELEDWLARLKPKERQQHRKFLAALRSRAMSKAGR